VRRLAAVVVVLLAALSACQPLYLPLVPARVPVQEVAQLGDASSLTVAGGTLRLHLVLEQVPKAGWLAVQWFGPDGREAASDSVWVTPADDGQGRTLSLPARVAVSQGEWRALVSVGSDIVRQFRVTVATP